MDMKIKTTGHMPTYANEHAAGLDLRAKLDETVVMNPGDTYVFPTGLHAEIPNGYFGLVAIRSGLGFKGFILSNGVGIIDEDYRGEIRVKIHHHGEEPIEVQDGERIAQMILIPYVQANLIVSEELSETERGEKGMGSSGRL